jgi:hypothetical protein
VPGEAQAGRSGRADQYGNGNVTGAHEQRQLNGCASPGQTTCAKHFTTNSPGSQRLMHGKASTVVESNVFQDAFCLALNHHPHDDNFSNSGYSYTAGFVTARDCRANRGQIWEPGGIRNIYISN